MRRRANIVVDRIPAESQPKSKRRSAIIWVYLIGWVAVFNLLFNIFMPTVREKLFGIVNNKYNGSFDDSQTVGSPETTPVYPIPLRQQQSSSSQLVSPAPASNNEPGTLWQFRFPESAHIDLLQIPISKAVAAGELYTAQHRCACYIGRTLSSHLRRPRPPPALASTSQQTSSYAVPRSSHLRLPDAQLLRSSSSSSCS
jgi:hypothetical protein